VSALFALGDSEVAGAVLRGCGGVTHGLSRAMDPHVHTGIGDRAAKDVRLAFVLSAGGRPHGNTTLRH